MPTLHIKTLNLGELQTNSYLVWSQESQAAVIIDPADSGDLLSELVLSNELTLQAIIMTHGHFDHCLGLLELSLNFSVPSYIHPADVFLIRTAQKSAQHWLKHSVDPVPLPSHRLHDQELITFDDFALRILHTPGHTPGSVCLEVVKSEAMTIFVDETQIMPSTTVLFSGDTLFKESFPETNHQYSSVLQLNESWHVLKKLSPDTTMLAGHGEQCTLDATVLYNRVQHEQ